MFSKRSYLSSLLVLFVALLCSTNALGKPKKKDKALPKGTAILWRAPINLEQRDLLLGPGGRAMEPNLSKIKFLKNGKKGYSTKYHILDGSGNEWVAKIGKEAQSETAAVRLLWAVGYETEVNYLVPRLTIPGKGTFQNVRLEARPDSVKRYDEWKWEQNPFRGRPEFDGLKVMMVLLNNWDIKNSNNVVLVENDGGQTMLRYAISDLGATFGKTGHVPFFWRILRSRSQPKDYERAKFIDAVDHGLVDFHFGGRKREMFDNIPLDRARWIGSLLSRLSEEQIKDAFRAANYRPAEIEILTDAVQSRISQLINLGVR
jgi:hypothetical protein